MNNQRSPFFNVDWIVILVFLALCIIGWFNIHAAVYNPEKPSIFNLDTNYGKQLIFIVSALIIGLVILLMDSKFFNTFSPVFYGITLLLLILVLIVGRNVGGNQAWIPIGSFRLQPSEFAKFATCLLLARYLSMNNVKVQDLKTKSICAAIILLPMGLIMLQPDTGSALTFFALIFVLYREGLSGYFLIIGALFIALFVLVLLISKLYLILALVVIGALLIYNYKRNRSFIRVVIVGFLISVAYIFTVDFAYNNILQSHQRNRIDVLLGKVQDLRGEGYNVNQSKIAIGSGGLLGKGYLKGTQTRYDFVPEQSTDFIFCTIGEEWGFVGSFVVIGLYLFLLLRIINIAERQRSSFSRIYGYGVASILFFHFFINIGMTVGLAPVIGIPLPFISYGGSSLWSFTILLFILLKLDSNRMGII
ncbi:rod shape-determining protein RodA [Daejeonella oryzae]|uniref:rod shape-determining protein RodA n=1 Tax=Daejeonella oryzae TaxID=1122943 RepID=UPI00040CF6EB|nr:rod shape-determining protein RodA [Daejeonella oryzae]